MKKFDIIFSNPPYNNCVDLRILNDVIQMTDDAIVVHPSGWILNLKDTNTYKAWFENKVKSIKFIWGNDIFGIALWMPVAITHFKKNTGKVKVIDAAFNLCEYEANYNDITMFSNDWDIVKSIKSKIETWIKSNSSIEDNRTSIKDISDFGVKITFIHGRGPTKYKQNRLVYDDDMFCLAMQNSEMNKWKNCKSVLDLSKPHIEATMLLWDFENSIQQDNFISYLKTKFARFCLALLKNNQHLDGKACALIPYLDYSKRWTDDNLKEYFNLTDVEFDYIEKFIPKYYKS